MRIAVALLIVGFLVEPAAARGPIRDFLRRVFGRESQTTCAQQSVQVNHTTAQVSQTATGSPGLTAAYGDPVKLKVAIQSATHRAQHGISGHSPYDSGRRSGVGYSWAKGQAPNPRPGTCLGHGDNDSAYASVCVGNECYSTVID